MRHRRWFWGAIALQVLVLISLVGIHGYTLATGRPVMLKTAPVDPWDPLRGEYINLSYEISRLEQGKVTMTASAYRQGETVWVLLQPEGQYWNAILVDGRRPLISDQQIALRGTVEIYNQGYSGQPAQLWVRYGIEQFYVPEGEAHGLPGNGDRVNMAVEAVVDDFGRAALHRVYLDGQEIRWR
jgi:uncharacterized membrane-anchored protein